MCDKYVCQLENIPGGEGMNIAEIEHDGPVFKQETDEQGRIFKWSVYESGKQGGAHDILFYKPRAKHTAPNPNVRLG